MKREERTAEPLAGFGPYLSYLLRGCGMSASEAARRLGYKSRNSLFRLLDGKGSYAAMQDCRRRLKDCPELGLTPEQLAAYGREVDSFYLIFEDAYRLGVADGSVRAIGDFRTFYRSVAHSLRGLAETLFRGDVIPSDDFRQASKELDCLVDMAVRYIRL